MGALGVVISVSNAVNGNKSDPNKSEVAHNSFHRILPSDYNSDSAEDSDTETIMSSSRISPIKQTSSNQSTMYHNTSFNSTKSLSPSVFTASVLHQASSLSSLHNRSFDSSSNKLNTSFTGSAYRDIKNVNQFNDNQSNYSFRTPCIPEEFQKSISNLNLNSDTYGYVKKNNHQSGNLCQRNSLICPSKLAHSSSGNASVEMPQTSWLAGGYWQHTGLSPQKKSNETMSTQHQSPKLLPAINDLMPIMSRTSSQSSGFESQAGGCSRESSVCGTVDVFSDIQITPSDSVSQCGEQLPFVRQPIYPTLSPTEHTFIHSPAFSNRVTDNLRENRFGSDSSHQFGSSCNLGLSPHHYGSETNFQSYVKSQKQFGSEVGNNVSFGGIANGSQSSYSQFGTHRNNNTATYNFNKLTNNLPIIQKGSLLKSWKERSESMLN